MRVISICPSNTELLAYMDSLSLLVGVDDFSDWPASIQALPKLGLDLSIRMDDLEALKPDLVLASLSVPGMEKNVVELNNRNIPHIVLNPQSLQDIADDLVKVGTAIGLPERGKEASRQFLQELERFREISSAIPQHFTLYWEWWPKPVFTPGNINWLTEVSHYAGGINVYADVNLASIQTDWQDVYKRDPDYICLAWVGIQQSKVNPDLVKKRPHWDTMRAVQNNHILILEESLYCRPSPRLLTGINQLGNLLHPDYYSQIR